MQVNAACSLFVGAALLTATSWVDGQLRLGAATWLHAFGVILLAHAAALVWATTQARQRRWAQLNVLAIAPYPLLLLVIGVTIVTAPSGRTLLFLDGVLVGGLALWHAIALRHHRAAATVAT